MLGHHKVEGQQPHIVDIAQTSQNSYQWQDLLQKNKLAYDKVKWKAATSMVVKKLAYLSLS